ncbi:DLH domain-containing protein [Citrus sinensis]|nr:DLH domain-containing protein [Citrus sinensis]
MSGPQCCANPPTLNPNSGAGHVEKLGGLNAYVTGSPDSKLAVLLISDVYGYEAPNLRKLADKVAAAGFYVAVPDFFHGDPYVADGGKPLQEWIKDHGVDKGFEEAKPVIQALKSKGITAIGAAGFCWGAKVVVQLGKREFIQAAVLLHPSFVTVDDIKGVEVPLSILGAEIDRLSPPALVKEFEEALNAISEVDSFVKIFPKVAHGWTVRYNVEDESAVKAAEEAHQNLLEWFAKCGQAFAEGCLLRSSAAAAAVS